MDHAQRKDHHKENTVLSYNAALKSNADLLVDHLHRIVMTQLTIKNKVHHLKRIANLLQQPLDVLLDETKRD